MARFKLSEEDDGFLATPNGASVLFSGTNGTETFIERVEDGVVRLGIQSVAAATADGARLIVTIEVGGQSAQGEDGPAPTEYHLTASQAVQLLVKAGERVSFKAYPTGQSAQILRTVVWVHDLGPARS